MRSRVNPAFDSDAPAAALAGGGAGCMVGVLVCLGGGAPVNAIVGRR
jgi:hypothetical protein